MSNEQTHARDNACDIEEEWKCEEIFEKPGVRVRDTDVRFTVLPINYANGKSAFNIEFFNVDGQRLKYDTSKIATSPSEVITVAKEYIASTN